MTHASFRRRRMRLPALAVGAALLVILTFALSRGASASTAAAGPEISSLTVTPKSPIAGQGFVVRFRTTTGGTYTVYEAAANSGGPLTTGATAGGRVTTKKVGKQLKAGKYTIGVAMSKNGVSKKLTKKIVIK